MAYNYLQQKYSRPSLIIFTENEPKAGESPSRENKWELGTNYLYLSDNNRSDLAVSFERIEHRQRMINGTMRSYHIADKKTYSTSWKGLPSRNEHVTEYNVFSAKDGIGGGQQILDWYKNYPGSFWVLFVYDVNSDVSQSDIKYNIEPVNVFFESFSYNVTKRGTDTDLWDISLSLVEV